MTREHSAKKLSLITVLAMLILISIVVAVKLPAKQGGSNSAADVKLLHKSLNADQNYNLALNDMLGSAQSTTQTWNKLSSIPSTPTNSAVAENIETIVPDASEQVTEETRVIAINPSPGIEVQNVRTDSSVSRGTKTNTYTVSNTGPNDIAHFWQNRKTWLQPVKGKQTTDPTGGARYFGASRANGRAHAAIDFIAPGGTAVYAMTDGKVIRTSLFFQNTSAVEVQNTDGTIARYGEISPTVSVGTIVHRGDVIGKIMTNNAGTAMLHLEMYMGTSSGSLSQGSNSSNYKYVKVRNYERRSDLIDPTGTIYLPVK
ncbi:MAG: M23 family metallopeptidase [Syntrophomonas sp.]|nr:M23 family metallopeptidase [Syntrophomonas sp.]